MSYKTLEVELVKGRVIPCHAEVLPEHASALLTIITANPVPADHKKQPSLGQLMRELAGTGKGLHPDLSTNKQHLAGLGR